MGKLVNYIKQNWDSKSTICPSAMNHIEQGIKSVADALDLIDASMIPYRDDKESFQTFTL